VRRINHIGAYRHQIVLHLSKGNLEGPRRVALQVATPEGDVAAVGEVVAFEPTFRTAQLASRCAGAQKCDAYDGAMSASGDLLRDASVQLSDGRLLPFAEWGDPAGRPVLLCSGGGYGRH
jgi:hypothetical protein